MTEMIIDIAMIIILAVVAYSCGYQRGFGDALEDEIDFLDKLQKKREKEKKDGEN